MNAKNSALLLFNFVEHKQVLCGTKQGYVHNVGGRERENAARYKLSEYINCFNSRTSLRRRRRRSPTEPVRKCLQSYISTAVGV